MVQQIIFLAVYGYTSLLIVDLIQQKSVRHMEFRTTHHQLTFQFKLNNGNGLVHLNFHFFFHLADAVIFTLHMLNGKKRAWIIPVNSIGKVCQRHQIDTIIIFQRVQVAITGTDTDHIGNAGRMAAGCSHPEHIMIAPLDINRMIGHQLVHDCSRSRSSVENITHNMQMIHNQTLDQIAHSHNKFLSTVDADDRIDNLIIISFFIQNIFSFVEQFFNNISEILRQCFSDLGTGIF